MFCRRVVLLLVFVSFAPFLVRAGTLAQFRTVFGDMELELYDQDKPVTVQNFIRYVQTGAYTNSFSHRLVPGFVVQSGGFTLSNHTTVYPVPTFPPITNEFGVGRRFSNIYGTIAMAKVGGDTNSATSQWFLNFTNNGFLDASNSDNYFVVFGHIIKGTNVLNILNKFQYYNGTQTSNLVADVSATLGSAFNTCPLLHPSLQETNLLFIDVSLLQVAITAAGTNRLISWNSATGLTNIVEYTTNMPPAWKTLATTNGNGNRFTVTDRTPTNAFRFYRVRVVY